MRDNNDLNEVLLDNNHNNDNDNDNNYNDNNDDENMDNIRDNINLFSSCSFTVFLFVILICFLYNEVYRLIYLINFFRYQIKTESDIIFEKCIKYPSLAGIYIKCFSFLVIFGLFTLLLIPNIISDDQLLTKMIFAVFSFNFYIFGPLWTGFSTLGLIFANKICYICQNDDPQNLKFDFTTFLILIISFFFGINILLGRNSIGSINYLTESIRFTDEGNYFYGKLFWKIAQWRRRRVGNNEIRN